MSLRATGALAAALILCGGAATGLSAGDRAGAESQYRVARRLAAEGSAGAKRAMQQVLQLDPDGPRADDALVELARLAGAADAPERLGHLAQASAREVAALLSEARARDGDRSAEARYLGAVLQLEPLSGFDPSAARAGLIEVATAKPPSKWSASARYALGWLEEVQGHGERARAAYHRLLIDEPPGEPATAAARVGLARLLLREGASGAAAARLQEAVDAGVGADSGVFPLRELAMRRLLGSRVGSADAGQRREVELRGLAGFAATPDGGVWIADRRVETVTRRDARGRVVGEWTVAELQALACDASGRAFVAAGDALLRLESRGRTSQRALLGESANVESLAVDRLGGVWLLDRRGGITRVDPGATTPRPFWEDREVKLESLIWDGERLAALDVKNRRLVTILLDGSTQTLLEGALMKPAGLAVDPSGRLALLDSRAGFVFFTTLDGRTGQAFAYLAAGIERPSAVALGGDGALHLLDVDRGVWYRAP